MDSFTNAVAKRHAILSSERGSEKSLHPGPLSPPASGGGSAASFSLPPREETGEPRDRPGYAAIRSLVSRRQTGNPVSQMPRRLRISIGASLAAIACILGCEKKRSGWRYNAIAEAVPLGSKARYVEKEMGKPTFVFSPENLLGSFRGDAGFSRGEPGGDMFEVVFEGMISSTGDHELVDSGTIATSSYRDFVLYSMWYWQLPSRKDDEFRAEFLEDLPVGSSVWVYGGSGSTAWIYFLSEEKVVMKSRVKPWHRAGMASN